MALPPTGRMVKANDLFRDGSISAPGFGLSALLVITSVIVVVFARNYFSLTKRRGWKAIGELSAVIVCPS
jgi:hypothetical protein